MIPLNTPPGAEVICIDDANWSTRCPFQLRRGCIYTVRGWTNELFTNNPLVDLEEVYHEEWAPEPWRFRLIDIGRLDMLLDAREQEPA